MNHTKSSPWLTAFADAFRDLIVAIGSAGGSLRFGTPCWTFCLWRYVALGDQRVLEILSSTTTEVGTLDVSFHLGERRKCRKSEFGSPSPDGSLSITGPIGADTQVPSTGSIAQA